VTVELCDLATPEKGFRASASLLLGQIGLRCLDGHNGQLRSQWPYPAVYTRVGTAVMSGTPMTEEEFTDELDELMAAGRDGGLSDEDMIVLLERATKALREGPS
jgi:hypothetical protein